MQKPFLIILDGPMGAGKSTVAKNLHLKLDRTALLSWDDLKWIVNGLNDTVEDKDLIANIRLGIAREMLSNQINVIIEGGFHKRERLNIYLNLVKELNLPCFKYYFSAAEQTLLERALSRPKPVTEKDKISEQNILNNIKSYPEKESDFEFIETDCQEVDEVVLRIISDLS